MDWVHRARCKDEDPELFFPVGTTGPAAAQMTAAKAICMLCEVRGECLEWAMATGQDAGGHQYVSYSPPQTLTITASKGSVKC